MSRHGKARQYNARNPKTKNRTNMKTVTAKLKSASPYSQSRHYQVPELERETKDAYETRTWRNRLHVNDDGNVIIPPMAFKNALSTAAKFLSIQVPGKGKKTYTKSFEAGVLTMEPITLQLRADEVEGEWLFVPTDGIRGSGKRCMRCFPLIRQWSGSMQFIILDELITEDVFRKVLTAAGQFVGIGRFRPFNNGFYGRFNVEALSWA